MEGVMAAEGDPIRKANSLARLAGHYLKTCYILDMNQAYKHLVARVAELEQALAPLVETMVMQSEPPTASEAEQAIGENPTPAGEDQHLAGPPVTPPTLDVAPVGAIKSATGKGRTSPGARPHSRAQRKRKRK